MKYLIILSILSLFLQSSSCNREDPLGPQVINNSLVFLLKKGGNRLPDSILNNTKLVYFLNGQKNYLSDFARGINEGPFQAYDLGVLTTRNIGSSSGDNNVKEYYLEYPNGTKDTLFVDYRHVSYNEAINNSCYCYYPLEQVKYNGVVATLDSTITQQKVYKFYKP